MKITKIYKHTETRVELLYITIMNVKKMNLIKKSVTKRQKLEKLLRCRIYTKWK